MCDSVPSDGLGGERCLPYGSHLHPSGLPSECTYTPFWSASYQAGALLSSSSSSSNIVYRGRGPEPSSLLTCYLGGFKPHDRSLPLGRASKKNNNPTLEVEVVNAVGVCCFDQLLQQHPQAFCMQPCCCCCSARLPTDPDPYGAYGEGKKAAAATAAAAGRCTTVLEEYIPYQALQEIAAESGSTPVLVLPCGLAHSGLELVAVSHHLDDVVYTRNLPRYESCMHQQQQQRRGRGRHKDRPTDQRRRRSSSDSSSSSDRSSNSSTDSSSSENESGPASFGASVHAAGCSLGLGTFSIAELHPHTFQWTKGEGKRISSEAACSKHSSSISNSCCCCSSCCWCPMGAEADSSGCMRNIFARGEARHAPDPLDTLRPKESVASEKILEVKTDDKHPFSKFIFARNTKGIYVAKLKYEEDDLLPEEAAASLNAGEQRQRTGRRLGPPGGGPSEEGYWGFEDGGVRRQLKVQVLHDCPYGRRLPKAEGGPRRGPQSAKGEVGSLVFGVPKPNPPQNAVINIAVSCDDVGEAAFLYNCNLVGIWRAEEARMNMDPPISLSLVHAPTHGSTVQSISEALYAGCTANSSYHTSFTAVAPHPQQQFLLAAAHAATETICLFDARAMHEPLTVIGLPSTRKMGSRYRSLLWHSSKDKGTVLSPASVHPSHLSGAAGRRAAVSSAAAAAAAAAGEDSSTHDLLAAFSWRNEDVVCSYLRIHPAYCPPNPHQSLVARSSQDRHIGRGGRNTDKNKKGNGGDRERGRQRGGETGEDAGGGRRGDRGGNRRHGECISTQPQRRPNFEPSPLEAIRSGCLPAVINRETVEVSWQAEVCMFPRTSWGLEHRDRSQPIPSRTPVGSSWLQQQPQQVTVDEVAATASFHGFAGAGLLNLPISRAMREALINEGKANPGALPRRIRCSVCGTKNTPTPPLAAAAAATEPAPAAAEASPGLVSFCKKCASPISNLCGLGGDLRNLGGTESPGSIAVLVAFTTSGRLTCRPLLINDPVLQLRMQRRSRVYAQLARRQRRRRENHPEIDPDPDGGEGDAAAAAAGSSTALAALFSFHASRLQHPRFVAAAAPAGSVKEAAVSEAESVSASCTSSSPSDTAAAAPDHGVGLLLQQLQGSPNEVRVLPKRIPSLLLQLHLQQLLQQELLFRSALRLQRQQQLRLQRRAVYAECIKDNLASPAAAVLLRVLRDGLQKMQFSPAMQQQRQQNQQKLPSFSFCDSGSFGIHKPAFDTEAYDPEPLVQLLLANAALDSCLDQQAAAATKATTGSSVSLQSKASQTQEAESTSQRDDHTEPEKADGREAAPTGNGSSNDCSSSSRVQEEDEDTVERAACVAAVSSLLEGASLGCDEATGGHAGAAPGSNAGSGVPAAATPSEALGVHAAAAEISGLPFPSARSRAVFRYAVEAVETLHAATTAGSLLQLRDSDTVLLHDLLVAVQLYREGRIKETEIMQLISPFNSSRVCTPGLLDMKRTTLPLGLHAPSSPEEAFSAAAAANAAAGAAGDVAADAAAPEQAEAAAAEATRAVFRRVSNPAVAPALPCCCRVLLQHHCDVHACTAGPRGASLHEGERAETTGAAAAASCPGVNPYPHTDGIQALLALLREEVQRAAVATAATGASSRSTVVRGATFVPQALVDELAETLFLTHEVLLLPAREPSSSSTPNCSSISRASAAAGEGPTSAAGAHVYRRDARVSAETPGSGGYNSEAKTETASKGQTDCFLSSPVLPSYCLSRYLYTFVRKDLLVKEEEALQHQLQRHAWPELLLQQQRAQAANAAATSAVAAAASASEPVYSQYPRAPVLHLPLSMQPSLPEHVIEGLGSSKWKRLLCGVAVNGVLIADLLRHWEVPLLQRMREIQDNQEQQLQQQEQRQQQGDRDQDEDRVCDPRLRVVELPRDAAGPVSKELQRLLQLLQQQQIQLPPHLSFFVNVQQRQQEQRRKQAERQQLLDSIARAMRRRN
ncbi:hypothetical protein, conserved [Eimeria brunetti]|uniref:Uncharacterized protein n=1 Tax=Eimeria brunetti TaxID=51314 RepID=U6LCH4_9EIME|nr:hypothetical protein, conserved [Eimeria brunetti]